MLCWNCRTWNLTVNKFDSCSSCKVCLDKEQHDREQAANYAAMPFETLEREGN